MPPSGCPPRDRDGDTLVDGVDKCPELPGPAVNGGCPDVDSDGDRIADRLDECPTGFGVAVRHGCPGPGGTLELAGIVRPGPGGLDARTRAWLARALEAMRANDGQRLQLSVVAEYGLSYGDSLDRARARALALQRLVAGVFRMRVQDVAVAWRGPDGKPRLILAYQ
ncbi:MAG TPA: hypothetical protein VL172_13710 [Kofleriaceae bacterium]|nr:hypothetical protein [Kofleriaceae bacterium]